MTEKALYSVLREKLEAEWETNYQKLLGELTKLATSDQKIYGSNQGLVAVSAAKIGKENMLQLRAAGFRLTQTNLTDGWSDVYSVDLGE